MGGGLIGAAVTPDGQWVYATALFGTVVSGGDTSTAAVNCHNLSAVLGWGIPLGNQFGVATAPDGQVYVTVGTPAAVVRFPEVPGTCVTFPNSNRSLPYSPNGIAVAPSGKFAYVIDNTNTLSVLQIDSSSAFSGPPIQSIPSPPGLAVAVGPSGKCVYVTTGTSLSVFTVPNTSLGLVNPAYPSFTVNLPGAFWVAVTPDGTLAYVTSPNSSAVFVVNTSPTTCKTWGGTTIPMWGSPYGVAIAPF